jgi:hypothetical protein
MQTFQSYHNQQQFLTTTCKKMHAVNIVLKRSDILVEFYSKLDFLFYTVYKYVQYSFRRLS